MLQLSELSKDSGFIARGREGLVSPGQGQVLLYRLETLPGALSVISQEAAEALMTVWQRVNLQEGTTEISVAEKSAEK